MSDKQFECSEELKKCIEDITKAFVKFYDAMINVTIDICSNVKNIDIDKLVKEIEQLQKNNIN